MYIKVKVFIKRKLSLPRFDIVLNNNDVYLIVFSSQTIFNFGAGFAYLENKILTVIIFLINTYLRKKN